MSLTSLQRCADSTSRRTSRSTGTSGSMASSAAPRSIDAARHSGYAISQVIRKRVEEIFGWSKPVGGLTQLKLRGLPKVKAKFTLALAAYDLVRIPKLLQAIA